MAHPGNTGEHSVRSLAEILQEHGLETELGTRPGRRRKEGESKADWPALPAPEDQPRSRLRPLADPSPGTTPPPATPPRTTPPRTTPPRTTPPRTTPPRTTPPRPAPAAAPYAEILREHGLESEFGTRPDRRRDGERRESSGRTTPPRNTPGREVPARGLAPRSPAAVAPALPAAHAAPAAPVASAPRTPVSPDVPMYGRRSTDAPLPPGLAPGDMPGPSGPTTAAIPALGGSRTPSGADDAAVTPSPGGTQGVLAWARFGGELVLAVAVGVGIYFAFTVLWELMPYVAVVAAPLTVTALVAGASAWRHRRGQPALGVRLLAVLLFAGTLLVIAPAAPLLALR